MPICSKCGANQPEGDRFCMSCGNPLVASNTVIESNQIAAREVPSNYNPQAELLPYTGQERVFTLEGQAFTIPEEMDAFIHYRKSFKHAAKYMIQYVMHDYDAQVRNLDEYFTKFPIMYVHYRRYLVDAAVKILVNYEIYDISREEFELELNKEFSKCNELYEALIEAFNNTIEDNQARAVRLASLLPNIYFGGGVLGLAKAFAYTAATSGIAEASIRNANVSQPQRRELFKRITRQELYENLYEDYWDVHYSLCFRLHERGVNVWYPSIETNTKAESLLSNIKNGLVPPDKRASALIQAIKYRPMQKGLIEYIVQCYKQSPEAMEIASYFGLEDEMGT